MSTTIESSKIVISIKTGTTRDLNVSWSGTKSIDHTKAFNVQSQQWVNGAWLDGPTANTNDSPKTSWDNLVKQVPLTGLDDAATKVRVRVKPIADTYKSNKSDEEYYKGDWSSWSAVFSGWTKTTKPPAFKVESDAKKGNRDDFKIILRSKEHTGKTGATFMISKSRMEKFLTYLNSFEFKWSGWNGANWEDINADFSYVYYNNGDGHAWNDPNITGYVEGGSDVIISDTVKAVVRGETAHSDKVRFRSYITPQEKYREYRFTVVPKSENQFVFDPLQSSVTKKYEAKTFKFNKKDLDIVYDPDEDQFELSWQTDDFDKYSKEVNHVAGFTVHWQYLKPICTIWNNAGKGTYDPDGGRYSDGNGETGETIGNDPGDYVEKTEERVTEYTVKTYENNLRSPVMQPALREVNGQYVPDYHMVATETVKIKQKTIEVPIRVWKYSFQLPEGIRRNNPIRIRILIKGDGEQTWSEEWSSWINYTNEVKEVSVDMAAIYKTQISSNRIDARWTVGSKETVLYTSGFSYQWYYMLKSDIQWIPDKNGTVEINMPMDGMTEVAKIGAACKAYNKKADKYDVDINAKNSTYTKEQLATYLNNPNYISNKKKTPGLYVWAASYDVPTEATTVMCTITPTPISDGYYIGKPLIIKYKVSTPTLFIDDGSVEINVSDAENREIFAVWDNITTVDGVDYSDYISGYECKWQYNRLNNWWESNGTAAYSKMNFGPTSQSETSVEYMKPMTTFTVPNYMDITKVRLSIRPTPSNQTVFKGLWCDWVEFPVTPDTLLIEDVAEYLEVEPVATTGRQLVAEYSNASSLPDNAWPYGTRPEDKHIIFEWSYRQGNRWYIDGTGNSVRIDYPNDRFTVPEDVAEVRVRIRADVDNIFYIGQWSEYVTYFMDLTPYKLESADVYLEMMEGSRNTVLASWIPPGIPDGRTDENYIDTFSIEWRYYFSGRYWPPDKSEDVASSNEHSDYVNIFTPSQSEATAVTFRIKPNPKRELDFIGEWSDPFPYDIPDNNVPDIPSVPEVRLLNDGYTMIVSSSFTDRRTMYIEFQIYDVTDERIRTGARVMANWPSGVSSFEVTGEGGHQYKFRARALNADNEYKTPELGDYTADEEGYSAWSSIVGTRPDPVKLLYAKGMTLNDSYGVELAWEGRALYGGADEHIGYVIERTQKKYYFDASSNVDSVEIEPGLGGGQTWFLTGLESGQWYFRMAVKTSNSDKQSEWSNIVDCNLGKPPTVPTTWSNKTVAMIGEPLYLYWTHNSEDNSDETLAEIRIRVNNSEPIVKEKVKVEGSTEQSFYEIPEEYCSSEAIIQWEVRTKGGYDEFSPWSTIRIIKVFTQPTVSLTLMGSGSYLWDEYIEEHESDNGVYDYSIPGTSVLSNNTMTMFPLFVRVSSGPMSQEPVSYAFTIVSNNAYETSDSSGRTIGVSSGMTIFRRYLNTSEHEFTTIIMPGDVSLENGMSYTINVTAAMSSGLTATASSRFGVDFTVDSYNINASIGYDQVNFVAYIKPYCLDDNNSLIDTVELAVYRRMFDGGLIKIADHIPGGLQPVVTDPHPSLDYARYRIVATDRSNGHVQYADLPPHPINCKSIIIQWDESWSGYFEVSEAPFSNRPWNGSMIILPYNIDTTDSNTVDVEMVEYIGRDHPVSYYGTQVGQKATWNALIPITHKQTIYDLRRLARYMGNAYVREPSGTGYWAHVEVSFNLTHLETTVPVSLSITRVEGGV